MEVLSRGILTALVVFVILHEVAAVGGVLNSTMARVSGALTGQSATVLYGH